MVELKIRSSGFVILPIHMRPKNAPKMEAATYKVDTGANFTTISKDWLFELGFNEHWIKQGKFLEENERPSMASGDPVDNCYQLILPEIRIGDFVGYNWPFLTSLTSSFRFLLGTDTMQFFNWNFDYEHGICKFDLIPGKRRLLFNSQEQTIHSLDVPLAT